MFQPCQVIEKNPKQIQESADCEVALPLLPSLAADAG